MSRRIVIASAGAGKTHRIISEADFYVNQGDKVLVVTYTENNQKELASRFSALNSDNDNFIVKGLFGFLLEDIVRPYQRCVFEERIETINFNSNGDPHKSNGKTIPGRKEKLDSGDFNPDYYLTKCRKKAHTSYLSKLASRILELKEKDVLQRLEAIYKHIYIDEVQDLVGWDYEVLRILSKSKFLRITCVGDFRQTIYDTSVASKGPKTSKQKLEKFRAMKYDEEHIAVSRRSVQCICDYADKIHEPDGYEKTISTDVDIPGNVLGHVGVYCVSETNAIHYIKRFNPVLLRHGVSSGKPFNEINVTKINFGKSKGLGFDRVLVVPTASYAKYVLGDNSVFDRDKSEESKNKLYVAITRARYSVAFIMPDKQIPKCELPEWKKG